MKFYGICKNKTMYYVKCFRILYLIFNRQNYFKITHIVKQKRQNTVKFLAGLLINLYYLI